MSKRPPIKKPSKSNLGGTILEGQEKASFMKRLSRYGNAKRRSESMRDFIQTQKYKTTSSSSSSLSYYPDDQINRIGSKLADCGNYLVFNDYYTVGQVLLTKASFCKQQLVCPLCAIRRGAKTLRSYLDRYTEVMKQEKGLETSLMTLTVKNGEDLLERFTHLQAGVKHLQKKRRNALAGGRNISEFTKVLGAVGSYEFTNKGNGWHPHVHMIILHREPIDQMALSAEWKKTTGDSFIVDVRPMDRKKEPAQNFLEVFKYAVKFSDLKLSQNLLASLVLKGKRLIFSFGIFRGVDVPDSLLDEKLDDLPFIELFFNYSLKSNKYLTGKTVIRKPIVIPQG